MAAILLVPSLAVAPQLRIQSSELRDRIGVISEPCALSPALVVLGSQALAGVSGWVGPTRIDAGISAHIEHTASSPPADDPASQAAAPAKQINPYPMRISSVTRQRIQNRLDNTGKWLEHLNESLHHFKQPGGNPSSSELEQFMGDLTELGWEVDQHGGDHLGSFPDLSAQSSRIGAAYDALDREVSAWRRSSKQSFDSFAKHLAQPPAKAMSPITLIRIQIDLLSSIYATCNLLHELRWLGAEIPVEIENGPEGKAAKDLARHAHLFQNYRNVSVNTSERTVPDRADSVLRVQYDEYSQEPRYPQPNHIVLPLEPFKTWAEPIPQAFVDRLQASLRLLPYEPVIVLGSVDIREAEFLLQWCRDVLSRIVPRRVRFLIVPGHVHEAARTQWMALLQSFSSLEYAVRTAEHPYLTIEQAEKPLTVNITRGELRGLYALADEANVCNSWIDTLTGRNVAEPILAGVPMVVGPGIALNRRLVEVIVRSGAGVQLKNMGELLDHVMSWLRNPVELQRLKVNTARAKLAFRQHLTLPAVRHFAAHLIAQHDSTCDLHSREAA